MKELQVAFPHQQMDNFHLLLQEPSRGNAVDHFPNTDEVPEANEYHVYLRFNL